MHHVGVFGMAVIGCVSHILNGWGLCICPFARHLLSLFGHLEYFGYIAAVFSGLTRRGNAVDIDFYPTNTIFLIACMSKHIRIRVALLALTLFAFAAAAKGQNLPVFSNDNVVAWYYIQFVNNSSVVEDTGNNAELRNRMAQEGTEGQLWKLVGDETDCVLYSRTGRMLSYDKDNNRFRATSARSTAMKLVRSTAGQWELQLADPSLAPSAGAVALVMNGGSGFDRYLGLWKHDFGACGLRFVAEQDMDFSYQSAPAPVAEVSLSGNSAAPAEPLSLWYRTPAANWVTQALPIGNGDMGAMILGGIAQDRIQFNHKTLWRGSASTGDLGTYLSFGDIYMTNRNAGPSSLYQRSLNLKDAVARVSYNYAGAQYSREYIASNPDKVIVIKYTASTGTPLSFDLTFINAQGERAAYTADGASFTGMLANGMCYRAELRLQQRGGTVTATRNNIAIENAGEITIYLTCATTFDPSASGHLSGDAASLASLTAAILDNAQGKGYEEVLARHTADYSELFGRVDFSLANAANQYPTNQLLTRTTVPSSKSMVDMLVFQYGRYLTIASSRGVAVPSNLQGIWNKDGNATSNAVWASDIHSNINVQMNYWPVESTNLSECHLPFLNYIYNEATRADGTWQKNAKELGVTKGWVVNTAGNIFGGSSNYKRGKYSVANAWYCEHLWQHYAYTRDRKYLCETAMPLMKSACEFWFERLVDAQNGDGTLECPNEYSPEQGRVQNATAHAQQLVTMLFENTLAAIAELGEESGCDEAFVATLNDKLARLDRGLRVDKNGLVREWKYQENTPNQPADQNHFADDEANVWQCHRHTSHLMALYPGFHIDPGIDRKMFDAAVAALRDRGDVSTGWARAWRISLWARTRNAEQTYKTLRGFAHRTDALGYDWHGGLYDNMLDAHATSVFQIEGNFGATAGIAEMLLQSRPDSLVLLPALPAAWANGHVSGLKAIGNFEMDLDWADGELRTVKVRSLAGQPLTMAYPAIDCARVEALSGNRPQTDTATPGVLSFPTSEGEVYTISLGNEISGIHSLVRQDGKGYSITNRTICFNAPADNCTHGIYDLYGGVDGLPDNRFPVAFMLCLRVLRLTA